MPRDPLYNEQPKSAASLQDMAFSRLGVYIAMMYPRYDFAPHHKLICRALERVERGECHRLIISVPPRHGKSYLCSEFFPSWYIGRNPEKSIIAASYGADLAEDFGRKVRNLMMSDEWKAVFPQAHIDPAAKSAARIAMKEGGNYYAVGVGGATTGRGANVLLIDDPVKGREEADSETIRRRIKDWYRAVAYTRLMKGGAIVIIMTRWHEDDLAGWCITEQDHENWELLTLPAIAEEGDVLGREVGEALWPARYNKDQLERIRQTVGTREWNALYMQRPAPEEGVYFQRDWFRFYDALPPYLNYYGASDYAVTEDKGDYTVHVICGVDKEDNVYLVDMWRDRTTAMGWMDSLVHFIRFYHPQVWAEETGVILRSLDPIIRKRLDEERLYSTTRKQFSSSTDKPTRARSLQARLEMGKLFFPNPKNIAWVDTLIHEFLSFPAGTHDDIVDAMSLLIRLLIYMQEAREPKQKETWMQRLGRMKRNEWPVSELFKQHFKTRKARRRHM